MPANPNADQLSYAFSISKAPAGGGGGVAATNNVATFTPGAAGDYEIKVVVTDALGAQASLTFPIHVTAGQAGCLCVDDGSCANGQLFSVATWSFFHPFGVMHATAGSPSVRRKARPMPFSATARRSA